MNAKAIGIAVLVLGALLWLQTCRLADAKADARRAGFSVDSLEAVNDTTRTALLSAQDSSRLLGDSLAIAQRRAVQAEQRRDALDRALGVERIATARLSARVASLTTTVTSSEPTRVTEDSVRATFTKRQPPYTVTADVALPLTPAPGRLSLSIGLDPIPLEVRPSCGPRNAQGVRSAQWTVTGPAWATFTLADVQQDPELCNPTERGARRGFSANVLGFLRDRTGVGPSYGVILAGDGRVHHGFGVAAIVRLWPR